VQDGRLGAAGLWKEGSPEWCVESARELLGRPLDEPFHVGVLIGRQDMAGEATQDP
jgi:hypothetical protein